MLWANLHLLFWLSLVPFVTGWMGENHFAPDTVALYGVVLLMAAVAYTILVRATLRVEGHDSLLAKAIGLDLKGNLSLALYLIGIAASFRGHLDRRRALHRGGPDLADPRPPDRTGARSPPGPQTGPRLLTGGPPDCTLGQDPHRPSRAMLQYPLGEDSPWTPRA